MRWFAKPDQFLIWNIPQKGGKPGILARVLNIVGRLSLIGFSCLYYYWCTHSPLPAPGQAVLIIGVIAALMALDMRNPLKAASIVLIFALAFLENKSIGSDREQAKEDRDAAFEIAQSTSATATQTLASIRTLRIYIDDLFIRQKSAEKQGNEKLVAQLRTEREAAQKQLLSLEVRGLVAPQPQAQLTPPHYQPPLRPIISSAPKIFTDGQIRGKDFGTSPAEIYLLLRVKLSAERGGYGPDGNSSNLLGNTRATNRVPISPNIIQEWTDSTITLKFPNDYWKGILDLVAAKASQRNIAPPQQSDLEVGYQIVMGDDESAIFYAQ